MSSPRCVDGCACATSANKPPTCWPPPKHSAGTPPSCCGSCSSPKPKAAIDATIEIKCKKAKFPAGKTFDAWDPARSSIPDPVQQGRRTLEWIDRHENVVVCGPSGTGKSHFCEALGHAVEAGHNVVWFSIEDLGVLVRRHRVDDTIAKAFTPILRAQLYRLIDIAYERRSVAMSSNLHPSGFDQLMHHAHPVMTEGESVCLNDAVNGKRVKPLGAPT